MQIKRGGGAGGLGMRSIWEVYYEHGKNQRTEGPLLNDCSCAQESSPSAEVWRGTPAEDGSHTETETFGEKRVEQNEKGEKKNGR